MKNQNTYKSIKQLAKEMMKIGNIGEYIRLMNELNTIQLRTQSA